MTASVLTVLHADTPSGGGTLAGSGMGAGYVGNLCIGIADGSGTLSAGWTPITLASAGGYALAGWRVATNTASDAFGYVEAGVIFVTSGGALDVADGDGSGSSVVTISPTGAGLLLGYAHDYWIDSVPGGSSASIVPNQTWDVTDYHTLTQEDPYYSYSSDMFAGHTAISGAGSLMKSFAAGGGGDVYGFNVAVLVAIKNSGASFNPSVSGQMNL